MIHDDVAIYNPVYSHISMCVCPWVPGIAFFMSKKISQVPLYTHTQSHVLMEIYSFNIPKEGEIPS